VELSVVVVAVIAGLAGGLASALAIVFAQAWMARPRGTSARFYSARRAVGQSEPSSRERFTQIQGGRGPFDRMNDRAKRVLALAQDEAIRFNHNYIGVEHVVLGLIREGEGWRRGSSIRLGATCRRLGRRSSSRWAAGRPQLHRASSPSVSGRSRS